MLHSRSAVFPTRRQNCLVRSQKLVKDSGQVPTGHSLTQVKSVGLVKVPRGHLGRQKLMRRKKSVGQLRQSVALSRQVWQLASQAAGRHGERHRSSKQAYARKCWGPPGCTSRPGRWRSRCRQRGTACPGRIDRSCCWSRTSRTRRRRLDRFVRSEGRLRARSWRLTLTRVVRFLCKHARWTIRSACAVEQVRALGTTQAG